jgi:amino acid transporter
MPAWLLVVLQIILFSIILLVIYSFLKKYLFSKIKVNKWVILILAILTFAAPYALYALNIKTSSKIINYVQMPLFVFLFLWYFDLLGIGHPKTEKHDVVIKPKAKPNRVKHGNENEK